MPVNFTLPRPTAENLKRFVAKISLAGPSECWEWTASLASGGYGEFNVGKIDGSSRKNQRSHRIAFEWLGGKPIGRLHVCHTCDNRKCCNPAHLFLGTNRDNVDDKVAKGRTPRGEAHPGAILKEADIARMFEMRAAGLQLKTIAAVFGCSVSHASQILTGDKRASPGRVAFQKKALVIPDSDAESIHLRHQNGEGIRKIARSLGVSQGAVSDALRRNGFPVKERVISGDGHATAKYTLAQRDEILALRAGGLLQREIAARVGCSASYVCLVLNGKARVNHH